MKTVLILGGDGMLGNALVRYGQSVDGATILATSRRNKQDVIQFEVDKDAVSNLAKIAKRVRPDFLINCIGVIRPGSGNEDLERSILVNSYFPQAVAQLCANLKIKMIHVSTDCVFRGIGGKYSIEDIPDELAVYGITKFLGEIRQKPHLTLRTSIIGRESETRKNLLDWFVDSAQKDEVIRGFTDVYWNGVTTLTLAKIIFRIIMKDIPFDDVLIQIASETVSKYELLRIINNTYGLEAKIVEDGSVTSDKTLIPSKAQEAYFEDLIPSLKTQVAELKKFYETSSTID